MLANISTIGRPVGSVGNLLPLGREFEYPCSHTNWHFLSHHARQVENDYVVGTLNSIYFTVDEEKVRLNPFRDQKIQDKHRRRKVEKKKNSSVAFLLFVTPAGASTH